jgi:cytochrome P450
MTLKDQVLKGHKRQIWLANILAKVGYDTPIGKFLRLWAYYLDAIVMLQHLRSFLNIRKDNIGEKFFAVDNAIIHSSHALVKELMQVEPQLRGNDLGIIRMLAPSYLLNHPLSLGMNGREHTGVRSVFLQALPDPLKQTQMLGEVVNQSLADAAKKGQLHIGKDLPRIMLKILHQLVFEISLSEEEITASNKFIEGLPLASLPNFISQRLLAFKTAPIIKHRQYLVKRYQQSQKWASYLETGSQYQLTPDQIANGLFDMIHIAGTAGTSALLGSVIGVLCLDNNLKNDVTAEFNHLWDGTEPLKGEILEQSTLIHKAILETARLYPAVRFVSQLAKQGGEVEIGETKCPFQRGTRLLGCILTANRDPKRYNNPDNFDTTRDFSDILSWNGQTYERACPGRNLSIGLIQIFCLYLLKKYKWDSITEVKWEFEKVTAVTPNNLVLQGFAQQEME